MKNKYEIIIIGAGPAGVSVALNLINLGINNLLIIDKDCFPRYKCCAGYITNRTKNEYERLGLNTNNIHYNLIDDFNIYYKFRIRQKINNKFLFTNKNIDRVELDNAFFNLLKSKNITFLENVYIKEHDVNNTYIILNNKQKIFYNKLIFADGVNSFGNQYQRDIKHQNIAMQVIFKSKLNDGINIHFGVTEHGYGWVSTYKGVTNVGLTEWYHKKINYNLIFNDYLQKLNIKCQKDDIKGTFTPIGIRKPIINNLYYVGDAVGACDPLTLSGIKYALITGKYCAKSIKFNNDKIYIRYINKLKWKFNFMKFLSHIFYLKGILFLIFNVGTKYFHKLIAYVFNNFFVNKK
jgi:menaquinone-9 beta-reductase